MALQLRRGTDAERKLVTFAEGELIYTSDTKKVFVGDGTTVGGKFVGGLAEAGLRTVTTFDGTQFVTTFEPEYAALGHLDMSNQDIIGVRKLSITEVDSNLIPVSTLSTLGSVGFPWGTLHVGNIVASSAINGITNGTHNGPTIGLHTGDVNGELRGNVIGDSGRVLVNWQSDSFDGIFQGPLYGSVYGADSSILVNAQTGTVTADVVGTLKGSIVGDDSSIILDGEGKTLRLAPLDSEPSGAVVGMFAVADRTNWDPASVGSGDAYPVFYDGTSWKRITLAP
jgi:hypothetical protein